MAPKTEEERAESHRLAQARYDLWQKENLSPEELEACKFRKREREKQRYADRKVSQGQDASGAPASAAAATSQAAVRSSARGAAAAADSATQDARDKANVRQRRRRLRLKQAASPHLAAIGGSLHLASPPFTAVGGSSGAQLTATKPNLPPRTLRRDGAVMEAALREAVPASRLGHAMRSLLSRESMVADMRLVGLMSTKEQDASRLAAQGVSRAYRAAAGPSNTALVLRTAARGMLCVPDHVTGRHQSTVHRLFSINHASQAKGLQRK